MRITDDVHHPFCRLAFVVSEREALPKTTNSAFALETRETSVEHQLDSADELVGMWTDGEEAFDGEVLEEVVTLRVPPAHENDHLVIELE